MDATDALRQILRRVGHPGPLQAATSSVYFKSHWATPSHFVQHYIIVQSITTVVAASYKERDGSIS